MTFINTVTAADQQRKQINWYGKPDTQKRKDLWNCDILTIFDTLSEQSINLRSNTSNSV